MAVKRICEVILRDEKSILPISTLMEGAYGIRDVVLSMPSIVGKDGVEMQVPIALSEQELKSLQESADLLKEVIDGISL